VSAPVEKPPLGSWRRLYLLLIAELVLVILAGVLAAWRRAAGPGMLFDAVAMLAFLQATALILNLLPLPGLDGFNALRPFLPKRWGPALHKIEGFALVFEVTLGDLDQIGDQIVAAFELHVDLGEGVLEPVAELDEAVVDSGDP